MMSMSMYGFENEAQLVQVLALKPLSPEPPQHIPQESLQSQPSGPLGLEFPCCHEYSPARVSCPGVTLQASCKRV